MNLKDPIYRHITVAGQAVTQVSWDGGNSWSCERIQAIKTNEPFVIPKPLPPVPYRMKMPKKMKAMRAKVQQEKGKSIDASGRLITGIRDTSLWKKHFKKAQGHKALDEAMVKASFAVFSGLSRVTCEPNWHPTYKRPRD